MCFNDLIKYCEKIGISVSVDSNPSEEKIAEIKARIKRNEIIQNRIL